jgi:cation transporter-like permease
MSRKTLLILAIVLVPVIGLIAGSFFWFPNAHFILAFALGAIATVLLSVGLFALSFLSARRGYDDRVTRPGEEE